MVSRANWYNHIMSVSRRTRRLGPMWVLVAAHQHSGPMRALAVLYLERLVPRALAASHQTFRSQQAGTPTSTAGGTFPPLIPHRTTSGRKSRGGGSFFTAASVP